MSKHTPGPWEASNAPDGSGIPGWNVFGPNREDVVCSMNDITDKYTKLNPHNARLIAAAPELLAALKDAAELIHDCAHDSSISPLPEYAASLKALIAKAEGE